jgi:hypothetical protein
MARSAQHGHDAFGCDGNQNYIDVTGPQQSQILDRFDTEALCRFAGMSKVS